MSDLVMPPEHHHLSIDQQLAIRTAAVNLGRLFADIYGPETIELFLNTSYDQFANQHTIPHFLPLLAERFARCRGTGERVQSRTRERAQPGDVPDLRSRDGQ